MTTLAIGPGLRQARTCNFAKARTADIKALKRKVKMFQDKSDAFEAKWHALLDENEAMAQSPERQQAVERTRALAKEMHTKADAAEDPNQKTLYRRAALEAEARIKSWALAPRRKP